MKTLLQFLIIVAVFSLGACKSGGTKESSTDESTTETAKFSKKVNVFGLYIYATNTAADEKLLHAASVLAEYIDNDEDGEPDNPRIMQALLDAKGTITMKSTAREKVSGDRPRGQGCHADETIIDQKAEGRFDAALEEILHMITDHGWAGAYPDVFGRVPSTDIANAMDKARGGQFQEVPDEYMFELGFQ